MASFHQWRKGLRKNPSPRQITYVCGEERVLVEEVVDQIKTALALRPWNYVSLRAGQDSERKIWAEIEQHPLDNTMRLVVVRDAEKLSDLERFQDWVKHRTSNPRTHLVLVSNEERIPKTNPTPDERKKGIRPEILPHLANLGTRGHLIECRSFTNATARYSIDWVVSKVNMPDTVARHLMERSNFELRLVRDICLKLSVFDGVPSVPIINELLSQRPRDSYVDAIFMLDRKEALRALSEVEESDYSMLLGQLDARLDLVGMIHDMQSEYHSPYEITKAAGSQAFLVKDLIPVAKHYDTKRRHSIRQLLAVSDTALRGGQSVGAMEALTLLW